jgi:hemerythrin-like domain-containing protein
MGQAFPGFAAPAAGFDEPMAMLHACHDRVRRSLDLLQRLAARVAEGRIDGAVRDAARDVLRYFDIAAPLHHEDEELHVFPPLLARAADEQTLAAVRRLQADHVAMRDAWAALRSPLEALAGGDDAAFDAAARDAAQAFVALYDDHAATEESLVFPAAAALLDADALASIGAEMAQRRGVAPRR